jgi:hypothetical protein
MSWFGGRRGFEELHGQWVTERDGFVEEDL